MYKLTLIWRIPLTHQWYTGASPGSLMEIKCDHGYQTTLARLTSSLLKCLSYNIVAENSTALFFGGQQSSGKDVTYVRSFDDNKQLFCAELK
ncbi:hypothetical protein TNCV_2364641 [Trichonephila clavipes]|nr:hypothetical protein TNCV_2364641 [Trichonephila clavipes]